MSIFRKPANQSQTKISNIRITQSVQGNTRPVVMGAQRIQQALLWMGGLTASKESQGGKGGGKGGSFYLYAADVLAALCWGPVAYIGDVWSGQSWLNSARTDESIVIATVYSPTNGALLIADNGAAIVNAYSQSFTDYGAPAATVLSGSDLSPLIQVPYGTTLTAGHYSINESSIGTFTVTAAANASGGNTVYTGTFTGGASPFTSGASNAYVGFRFVVGGFTNAANNGTFICVASSATTLTLANTAGVAETIVAGTARAIENTYHFAAADAGKTAHILYQFHLQALLAEELDLIPSGKVITVGGTFTPITDLGVRYYNPGGGNDGQAFTVVTGTPTVAGTYKFHDNGSGGGGGATYTFATGDINAEVRIKYGFQDNAAVGPDAPTTLNFEFIGGGQSQLPWSVLTSKYPQAALGYTRMALVGYAPMSLGTSAQIQDNTFEVITPDGMGGGIIDCNPILCILRVLTNTAWGLGSGLVPFPISCIDNGGSGTWGSAGTPGARTSNSTAWNWFAANSFFISPILDNQGTAASHIANWLEAGMCAAFMSEGLLKFVPYGDTSAAGNGYTWEAPQNFIVALDDTCFLAAEGEDPVSIKREPWQDAYNEVQVQWNNRSNQYAPEVTPEFDQAAINRYGLRIEDPKTRDFICTLPAAQFAASLRVRRSVNIRNTYSFKLPFTYSYLEPMDIATISTSSTWAVGTNNINLAISGLPVRITKIVDDPEGGLEITAEDYPWGTHQPVLFNKGISAGEVVLDQFEQPGDTQAVILEPNNRLANYRPFQLWIGALGQTNKWGGCNIWVSVDGDKYATVGQIQTPARMGVIDGSSFPSGSDPDTTHSLIVDLAANSQPLDSGTSDDADRQITLCYVDGEIIAYSNATVTGQNQFTLNTYIRRGLMSSAIAAHSAGGTFLRLDDAIFKFDYDPSLAGRQIFFKFQSLNSYGNQPQDLSVVDAISFKLPGANPANIPAQTTDLDNPDFEISSDLPPIGWIPTQYTGGSEPVNAPVLSYDTSAQYAGARSLQMTSAGLSSDGSLYSSQVFVVRPGDQYQLSAALKIYSGTPTPSAALFFYDSAGSIMGGTLNCTTSSGSWVVVTARGPVPAGAVKARILLQSTGSSGVAGFDSINLVRKTDVVITDSQTTLTANYNSGSAKTLIATPVAGALYKISGAQAINRAATTSSTLPSLTLSYKDAGGITRTVTLVATSAANATSVITNFALEFHADSSAAITLTSASYASSGATSMRYSLGYTLTQVA